MDLIILASGLSKRFKRENYSTSKFLLPFFKKKVLDYLINIKNVRKIIIVFNENDFLNKNYQLDYYLSCLNKDIKLKVIKAHNDGPVFSLLQIIQDIELDTSYAITYCDYIASAFWESDFEFNSATDAMVLCYRNFHPHHIFKESIYGYLKCNSKGMALDYREKESFTKSKLDENCSAGLYIFRKGNELIRSIKAVYNDPKKYKVNGEFYVSMLLKNYIDRSLKVKVIDTKFFAQLGTPNDYEDHIHWLKNAINLKNLKTKNFTDKPLNVICLILVSGSGTRFSKEGYTKNKAFLELDGWPIIKNIIYALPKFAKYIFSIPKSKPNIKNEINLVLRSLNIDYEIVQIETPNNGQADSALQALNKISKLFNNDDLPIYICPCDSIIKINSDEIFKRIESHGIVVAKSNPLLRLNPESYSYITSPVMCDKFNNKEEKNSIENDHNYEIFVKNLPPTTTETEIQTLTGAFYSHSYIKLLKDLSISFDKIPLVNGEKYLDSFFQFFLLQKKYKITISTAEDYNSVGTPLEYKTSMYWNKFYESLINNQ